MRAPFHGFRLSHRGMRYCLNPEIGRLNLRIFHQFPACAREGQHTVFHNVSPVYDRKNGTGKLFSQYYRKVVVPLQTEDGLHQLYAE